MSAYPCPHCESGRLETVVSMPFIRGMLLAYQAGTKRMVGCVPCVRKAVYMEVAQSSLIGWFSITAIIVNPMCIVFGVFRGLFVFPSEKAVKALLSESGLPEEPRGQIDPLDVAYSLAAAMIGADGKVEPEEVEAATQIGQQLFEGFQERALVERVERCDQLPSAGDLAALIRPALTEQGCSALLAYLYQIAMSDGDFAPEEKAILATVAHGLGVQLQEDSNRRAA